MVLNNSIFLLSHIIIVYTILSACSMTDALETNHFDQKIWKALHGSLVIDNPRAKMVDDLKTNYLKAGMSQSDVEQLLGKADRIRNQQYHYRLGMRQFSVDYSFLTLVYDERGMLKEILDSQS